MSDNVEALIYNLKLIKELIIDLKDKTDRSKLIFYE